MKDLLKIISGVGAIVGIVGSAIAVRYWAITLVVLSILKLTNLIQIEWFGNLFVLSAMGTPLWMLSLGVLMYIFNVFILAFLNDI